MGTVKVTGHAEREPTEISMAIRFDFSLRDCAQTGPMSLPVDTGAMWPNRENDHTPVSSTEA
jgi:hypothetical protein